MQRAVLFLLLSVALHLAVGMSLRKPSAPPAGEPVVAMPGALRLATVQLQPSPPAPMAAPEPVMVAKAELTKPKVQAQPKMQSEKPPVAQKPERPVESARPVPERTGLTNVRSTEAIPKPAAPAAPVRAAAPVEVVSREPAFLDPPRQPSYPAQARRRNQQGTVLVEVRLDERGAQRELKVARSSGVESLDRAALEAVARWRFRPETLDGQAVPSRVQIPIRFALTASR
ncbi:energy transducer TonB [Pseudomonas indica]|uniref:Protein TonB n=1 Tax=Pseudomonas indica TaxID=137658 RepID=A0A1G9AZL8_9PSED|nr:energy transducer TonB [Pseudomonas indica]SDK32761.1 protein TonB [Pseudomonas indica]